VKALHKKYPFGFSVFECFTINAQLEAIPDEVQFTASSLETLSRTDVTNWNDLVEEIQAAGSLLPHPHSHPLQLVNIKTYSQQTKIEAKELLQQYLQALKNYRIKTDALCVKQQLNVPILKENQFDAFHSIVRLLLSLPDIPASVFCTDNVVPVLGQLIEICEHGIKRDELRSELFKKFRQSILQLNGEELLTKWNQAATKWFLPKYFEQSSVKKILKKHSLTGKVDEPSVIDTLEKIIAYQKEQQVIETNSNFLAGLLGFIWKNGECNWAQVIVISNTVLYINRAILVVTENTNLA
jgi:hypothetical protein